MPTIKHILFPFDFSPPGVLAARFVSQTAKDFGARVTLLGVVPPVWDVPPPIGIPPLPVVDQEHQERGMKARMETALTDELAGLAVERATERGDPAPKIIEFAEVNAAD